MKSLLITATFFAALLISSCGGGGGASSTPAVTTPGSPSSPPVEVPLTTLGPPMANGTAGVEFRAVFDIGFVPGAKVTPFKWTIVSGTLPAGLQAQVRTLDTEFFDIWGVVTTPGSFKLTLEVRDASPVPRLIARNEITLNFDAQFKFVKVNTDLKPTVVNRAYNDFIPVANGTLPITWSIASGSMLDPGLQLNSATGEISGTPTSTFGSFMAIAQDSSNPPKIIAQNYRVPINPALRFDDQTVYMSPNNVSFAHLTVTGGVPGVGISPYTLRFVSGALPSGAFVQDMMITGTATSRGNFSAVLEASDAMVPPNTDQANIHITVQSRDVLSLTRELPHGIVGVPYTAQLVAAYGVGPYSWSLTSGGLPAGLSLASDGSITGTPTAAETKSFTATVTDSEYQPLSSNSPLIDLVVRPAATGRNDTLATATPLSNVTGLKLSLSPYATSTGVVQPDQDYFKVTANGGETVQVVVGRVNTFGPLDPSIEILAVDGSRPNTCRNQGTTDGLTPGTVDPTPNAFDDPCVNDDIDPGVNLDSSLEIQVPGVGPQVLYIHVFDVNGNARPDMEYYLQITGVN
jgi:hypothetical protein